MKVNYHMHTARCHHAWGSEEDYIKAAIKAGFDEVGFADHCPWMFDENYVSHMRMQPSELDDYIIKILELKEKYADQISIKIGLECEYFPKRMNYLQKVLRYKPIDYIILGNHFHLDEQNSYYFGGRIHYVEQLQDYVNDTIEGIKTGLYSYLAHPDLIAYPHTKDEHYKKEMTRLCEACNEMKIPVEFNLLGLYEGRHYPCDDFWKIAASCGCKAIIGFDAHDPNRLLDDRLYFQARTYLTNLGMEIVDEINFLK